jgi:hypothetical protein
MPTGMTTRAQTGRTMQSLVRYPINIGLSDNRRRCSPIHDLVHAGQGIVIAIGRSILALFLRCQLYSAH